MRNSIRALNSVARAHTHACLQAAMGIQQSMFSQCHDNGSDQGASHGTTDAHGNTTDTHGDGSHESHGDGDGDETIPAEVMKALACLADCPHFPANATQVATTSSSGGGSSSQRHTGSCY
jgi:hypothetical protein